MCRALITLTIVVSTVLPLFLVEHSVSAGVGTHEASLRAIMSAQAEAWNRGDIDRFMGYYWKSDQLTFSSGGHIQRGWQATLENYRRRYPTPELMGKVEFQDLEFTPLGDDAYLVLGDWRLERNAGPIGGKFTLIFRRLDDRWFIIHDHTSRDEAIGNDPP